MKFNSAFVLAIGVGGGGFLDLSSATEDIAKSMTAARGGGGLRSATVVAGAVHPYQHRFVVSAHQGGGTVASAIIDRAMSMDNNMVMVQGEFKREVRRQTNDQLSRLLQDADTTESTTGEEYQMDDDEIVVLCMGGLTEISDRIRGWFANREDSSSGEAGGSSSASASSAGGLRNWFQDRQANQGST